MSLRVSAFNAHSERLGLHMEEDQRFDSSANDKIEQQICVAIAAHKRYRMPNDHMYLPVHVGKALHPTVELGNEFVVDNTGDNISELNNYYSELTAMYWLWKNIKSKYQGLVHYRRYFETKKISDRLFRIDRYGKILDHEEAIESLTECDIILPKHRNYLIETIYSHYAHTFDSNQLDEMRKILLYQQPDYIPAFDTVMQGTTAHMFNMMIMSRDKFDEYCTWLFPLLFDLQKKINPERYNAFNARYLGRVSEMMLDVWLLTVGYSYREYPVISPEPVNWMKKGSAFIAAKFGYNTYTKSF